MYGKSYERKKRELEEHFEIKSRIVDTKYDPGDAGQVLEVRYKGKTIMDAKGRDNSIQVEKGDYLEFIAYVTIQDPPADGTMIEMESPIQVTVSPTKPASCQ